MATQARKVTDRQRTWAVTALVVLQLVHGFTPGDGEEEGGWGLILGLVALVATLVALWGVVRRRPWGSRSAAAIGVAVAVGFIAYHGLPQKMNWNNPYWGDGSGTFLQWLSVAAVVLAGAACVYVARAGTSRAATPPPPA